MLASVHPFTGKIVGRLIGLSEKVSLFGRVILLVRCHRPIIGIGLSFIQLNALVCLGSLNDSVMAGTLMIKAISCYPVRE